MFIGEYELCEDTKSFVKKGFGRFEYENNDVYYGFFYDGKPFGLGLWFYANGTVYSGELYDESYGMFES